MHIAERHGHQSRRHSTLRGEDRVGIGTRHTRCGLQSVGNPLRLRHLHQKIGHHRIDGRSPRDDRSPPQSDITMSLLLDAGGIGRMGDIHNNGNPCRQSGRRSARSPPCVGDLLLGGGHGGHGKRSPLVSEKAQRFQDDIGPDPVIERSGDDAIVRETGDLTRQHAGCANINEGQCLVAVPRPDVDPEIVHLAEFVPRSLIHEVNRLFADHPRNWTLLPQQHDALPDEDLGIPATDGIEPADPVVVDMDHHDADLVDVAGEHDPRPFRHVPRPENRRVGVAADVDHHSVGEGRGFAPRARRNPFKAGRSRGIEQPGEQSKGVYGHDPEGRGLGMRGEAAKSPPPAVRRYLAAMPSRLRDTVASIWTWSILIVFLILYFPIVLLLRLVTWPLDRWNYVGGLLFRSIARPMAAWTPRWRFEIRGTPPADPRNPYVVIANHESFADIILLSLLPWEMKWLSKVSIMRIPIFGWIMWAARDIPVHRGMASSARAAMAECARRLQGRTSVMIFPEGTRSPTRDLLPFKDGAFRLAIDHQVPILPIALYGTRQAIAKHDWRIGTTHAVARILDPIPTTGLTPRDLQPFKRRVQEIIDVARNELRNELERESATSDVPFATP